LIGKRNQVLIGQENIPFHDIPPLRFVGVFGIKTEVDDLGLDLGRDPGKFFLRGFDLRFLLAGQDK
jgi:hypothetical protein